jgi:DNA (cytosine-5)-methyltransferase 1
MTLTFGSLFAGVGGFDMGFEQAGWDCKFQVEWDKNCQQILNKHWPDVPKWLDVSDVNGAEIPPVDCIIFGSPCQDLSVAGKRAGLEGERSGLFHEAVRIIKEMRDATNGTFPRWTVWENVAGALSSNNGRDFGTVINEMAKAGAHLQEYALLDAQHFGIPQRRRRVFLVSCFDSATADKCPDTLLPVTESVRGDSKKGKPKGKSVASTTTGSVGSDGGILGSEIVGSLNTSDAKMISTQYVNENKCVVEPMLLDGTRVDDVRVYEPPVQTLKERMGTGGNNVPMLAFDTQFGSNANVTEDIAPTLKSSQQSPSVAYPIQDGREIEKHQNGFGVASDGEPSYTLDQTGAQAVAYSVREDAKANTFSATELDHANALSALRPSPQSHHAQMFIAEQVSFYDGYNQKLDDSGIHRSLRIGRDSSDFVAQPAEPTMAVRRLTPLECERLMGWPDDHTRYKADGTEQADTHRYRQCGNGVASPVAQWVAEEIRKVEYAEG